MQFAYTGRDRSGGKIDGIIEAASVDAAVAVIRDSGIAPIRVEEATPTVDILEQVQEWWYERAGVSLDELVIFCRQMHALSRAGIPIVRGFRGLSESTGSVVLQRVLATVAKKLESGVNLATSLQEHRQIFSELFIAMIHVGENTGNLEGAFRQLAANTEMERITRKRVQQAVRYPIMVIGALVVALAVINIWVIPSFSGIFERLGADLPLPTLVLMATSSFFLNYWHLVLAGMAGAGYIFWGWIQTDHGRYHWDRVKLRIPLIGPLLTLTAMSRFSRNFAMMLAAGLPITQALSLVAEAVGNRYLGDSFHGMRSSIERGESLVVAAGSSGMFSPLVMQMLAVGEETGQIDSLLDEVANFYDEEVDYRLSRLSDAIEPILIFVMGILVLVLALGVFLPMWSLGEASIGR